MLIRFIDPFLARMCVVVYTTLCVIGSITSHGSNVFYVLGAIGGIASGTLYGLELLIERHRSQQNNDDRVRTTTYVHVFVQQFGAWAWVCYLIAERVE